MLNSWEEWLDPAVCSTKKLNVVLPFAGEHATATSFLIPMSRTRTTNSASLRKKKVSLMIDFDAVFTICVDATDRGGHALRLNIMLVVCKCGRIPPRRSSRDEY